MTIQANAARRKAAIDAILSPGSAGPDSGTLRVYSGSPPASPDAVLSGNTLLAEVTLGADAFPAASGAGGATCTTSLAGVPLTESSADSTGTATFFRVYASDTTTCVIQGTCTNTGGGGDLTLDNVAISAGVQFQVTGLTLNLTA